MMVYDLNDLMILNIKGVDYRCDLWNNFTNDEINRLNNSNLGDKDVL